jgi:hypothetical protein
MSKLKYGMAAVGAIAAVGVASLSLPQALAGDRDEGGHQPFDEQTFDQQSWNAQRAKYEYGLLKQECDTLHYSQPQAYEACLEKAKSTRQNLLTQAQGSDAGQGSQGSASNQSGQSGQKQGPIEKVTSVVKEKLVDWGLASPDQGRGGQPSAGQQGQGSQQASSQSRNPLQASFETGGGQGTQGQQSFGAGSPQGGQNVGQQGVTGQQFQGQQGQSSQGSFQGGNYGQQPQGQSWQQGTSGASQQFQSGGTQGQGTAEVRDYPTQIPQGSSSQQTGSTSGSAGAEDEHMNSVEYYQEVARRQYATLKQECDALKRDPSVYEQCQTYAKSIRDKITGMAEQNQSGG